MKDRVVDVEVEIRIQTERAVMVWDGEQEVWLPKSQIEINPDGTITLPEWLAQEKELI